MTGLCCGGCLSTTTREPPDRCFQIHTDPPTTLTHTHIDHKGRGDLRQSCPPGPCRDSRRDSPPGTAGSREPCAPSPPLRCNFRRRSAVASHSPTERHP